MIRKICKIFGAIAILFATSNAYSQDGFAVGLSGSLVEIEASGKETLRTTGVIDATGAASNTTAIGSVFAEYTWNNITLGVDYIPGEADISNSVKQRDDTDFQDGDTTAGTAVSNKAQASIEDHYGVYLSYPLYASFYGKIGLVQADIITSENLGTGSSYGDDTLDGYMFGFGVKSDLANNMFIKSEFFVTDYDDIKLTSDGSNIVEGDIDVRGITIAVGYQF